jgi:mannosyltransferase
MHDVSQSAGVLGPRLERSVLDRLRGSSLTLDIALVSSVSLLLGLIRLGAPSFWVDEAFTARSMSASYVSYSIDGYHWLYYSILRAWTIVAGTSEWALRFPSVVGAMIACALTVVLGRRLVGRWVGLGAGLFLATNPFVVKWSQQARGYTLLLALSLVATLLILRALERGRRLDWALYGLAFAAVVVWHPVAGLLLAPAHVVLAYQRRERLMPHGLLAVVIICALAVPWAAQIAMRSTGEGVAMNWLTAPTRQVATRAFLDVAGVTGLGALFALMGGWVLVRVGKRDLAVWLGTWALAPFLLALFVSTVRPVYLDRYLLVAAPAFALLAGVAVMGVGRRLRAVLVVAAVVMTAAGLTQWYSTSDGNWRGEDWRSAVQTVLDRGSEAEAIVVAPWSASPAARYYGADVVGVSTADSIWVINWSETGDDITTTERRALSFGDHRLVEKLQFGWRVSAQLWKRQR